MLMMDSIRTKSKPSKNPTAALSIGVVLLGGCLTGSGCATQAPRGPGAYLSPELSAPVPHTAAEVQPAPEDIKGPVRVGKEVVHIDELPTSRPYNSAVGLSQKADWVHDATFVKVQKVVGGFDERFAEDSATKERVPTSRFRIGAFAEMVQEESTEFSLNPEFDMDVNLPNAERKLKLFLTTRELDELPGTDPTDADRSLRLGLNRDFLNWVDASMGVKINWPPELFGKLRWAREWRAGEWQVFPAWTGFWESDEGFGTTTSLTWDRWLGRGLVRTATGVRWTEKTDGVEWDQNFIIGYAGELLEEEKLGRRARGEDLARGGGLRYTVFGHDDGSSVIDVHRVTLFYKFPLRKQWLYGVISPEVTFRNERDWESEPGIKIGLDMLFWGIGDR